LVDALTEVLADISGLSQFGEVLVDALAVALVEVLSEALLQAVAEV
jgi:hypothetical protein